MSEEWFYEHGGESRGPVDRATLERLAREGALQRSSLVWKQGFPGWKPASAIEGLFPATAPPAPPRPTPVTPPEPPTAEITIPPSAVAAATPSPQQAGAGSGRGVLGGIGARISQVADLPTISRMPVRDILVGGLQTRTKTEDIEQIFAVGTRETTPALSAIPSGWPIPRVFWRILGGAVAIYFLLRLGWTEFENPTFLPGMIFIGSFVVPLAVVVLFFELNTPRNVSVYQTSKMLLLGGALSLIATMIVFKLVTGAGAGKLIPAILTGLGEELGKALALLVVVNVPRYPWQLNGLLFGAAVGAGFAGFESAGYAFNIGIAASPFAKFVVDPALENVTLRAVFSPGGHVIWTAMVGSALWKVKGGQPFQINMLAHPVVLRRYAIAAVLHGLWDTHIGWLDWRLKLAALTLVGWYVVLAIVKQALAEVEAAREASPAA